MNVRKYIFAILPLLASLYACNNDDDNPNGVISVPVRDRAEQQANEEQVLNKYLETHFYTLVANPANPDYKIVKFDTIAGENSDRPPLSLSDSLESKVIKFEDVEYTIHILSLNKGSGVKRAPTFADSTLVTYRGELFYDNRDMDADGITDTADFDSDGDGVADELDGETRQDSDGDGIADDSDVDNPDLVDELDSDGDGIIDDKDQVDNNDINRKVFDSRVTPIWFEQISVVEGWKEALQEFTGASGFTNNPDGTVSYNDDFGNFTVFMPSGLAYYAFPPQGSEISTYAPLIFSIQLYDVNESDHDRDGIPSYLEDLDGDGIVADADDNTDGDAIANFFDTDDDNDGTQTKDEITVNDANDDGFITLDEITFYDDDGDGIKNHLDPDDTDVKN